MPEPGRVIAVRRILAACLWLSACNSPPLYESRAESFLRERDTPEDVIRALTQRRPLFNEAADSLLQYDFVPVLHLLAANPTVPDDILRTLAGHDNFEVRTGVASNPGAPPEVLKGLRTVGRYTTENCMLAGNSTLDPETLGAMYAGGEATLECFGRNPQTPRDVMEAIVTRGSLTAKAGLAANPNLPRDLFDRLLLIDERVVRQHLERNPNYARWTTP